MSFPMKTFKVTAILGMISMLALAGCGGSKSDPAGETGKPATETVQESLSNFYYEVDTASYEVNLMGDVQAPEGQVPGSVNFDVTLSGSVDSSNPAQPMLNLALMGSGSMDDGADQNVDAELRLDSEMLYFVVNEVSDFDGQLPAEMVSEFLGQWWSMPIPPGTFAAAGAYNDGDEELSEDEQKFKDLIERSTFFKDIEYVGEEDVMGDAASHYTLALDKEGIKQFVQDGAMEFEGEELSEADMADLDEALEALDFSGEYWIGVDDMIMRGMKGTWTITPPEGGSIDLTVDVKVGELNEPVSVEAPADAQEFDPFALMGGGF